MNIAVIFHSFSGNTLRAALFLRGKLNAKGLKADLISLQAKKRETNFFKQCVQAALKKIPELTECDHDLKEYAVVIFAAPVWAFTITPPLRSFLKEIKSLDGKKVACFLTYGSGAGAKRALRELEGKVTAKGATLFFSRNISGFKTGDKAHLEEEFRPLIEALNP